MKCSVPRCKKMTIGYEPRRHKKPPAPPLALCGEHQPRYQKDFHLHFGPTLQRLARRQLTRTKVAVERLVAVSEESASAGGGFVASWVSTWLQMVDNELLHSGNALGAQKGRINEKGEFVADGPAGPPKPSYPGFNPKPSSPLPEHATRAGQAAIAKREAEQLLLERQLAAETEEFRNGQRQVLELELKTRRLEALKVAKKAKT